MGTNKHTDQIRCLGHELKELAYQLDTGDQHDAAIAARTMEHEVHLLLLDLDPAGEATARITTSNGIYECWPIGSKNERDASYAKVAS